MVDHFTRTVSCCTVVHAWRLKKLHDQFLCTGRGQNHQQARGFRVDDEAMGTALWHNQAGASGGGVPFTIEMEGQTPIQDEHEQILTVVPTQGRLVPCPDNNLYNEQPTAERLASRNNPELVLAWVRRDRQPINLDVHTSLIPHQQQSAPDRAHFSFILTARCGAVG
jgi:hypothetical protein